MHPIILDSLKKLKISLTKEFEEIERNLQISSPLEIIKLRQEAAELVKNKDFDFNKIIRYLAIKGQEMVDFHKTFDGIAAIERKVKIQMALSDIGRIFYQNKVNENE